MIVQSSMINGLKLVSSLSTTLAMILAFEIFFDYNNALPEQQKLFQLVLINLATQLFCSYQLLKYNDNSITPTKMVVILSFVMRVVMLVLVAESLLIPDVVVKFPQMDFKVSSLYAWLFFEIIVTFSEVLSNFIYLLMRKLVRQDRDYSKILSMGLTPTEDSDYIDSTSYDHQYFTSGFTSNLACVIFIQGSQIMLTVDTGFAPQRRVAGVCLLTAIMHVSVACIRWNSRPGIITNVFFLFCINIIAPIFTLIINLRNKDELSRTYAWPVMWSVFFSQVIHAIVQFKTNRKILNYMLEKYRKTERDRQPNQGKHYLNIQRDGSFGVSRIGEKIQLNEDIYSLVSVLYLKTPAERTETPLWKLTTEQRNNHFKVSKRRSETFTLVILLVIFQSALLIFLINELIENFTPEQAVFPGNIVFCRFICVIILHCDNLREVQQGLKLMKYAVTHAEQFKTWYIPFICGLGQFFVAFTVECVNVLGTCMQNEVGNIVEDFVVYNVIVQFDDFLYMAQPARLEQYDQLIIMKTSSQMIPKKSNDQYAAISLNETGDVTNVEAINYKDMDPKVVKAVSLNHMANYYSKETGLLNKVIVNIRLRKESWGVLQVVGYFLFKVFKWLYSLIYYYYFPFFTFFITYYFSLQLIFQVSSQYEECRQDDLKTFTQCNTELQVLLEKLQKAIADARASASD